MSPKESKLTTCYGFRAFKVRLQKLLLNPFIFSNISYRKHFLQVSYKIHESTFLSNIKASYINLQSITITHTHVWLHAVY